MISPTVWSKPADGRTDIIGIADLYIEQGCVNIMCNVALAYSADKGKQNEPSFSGRFH